MLTEQQDRAIRLVADHNVGLTSEFKRSVYAPLAELGLVQIDCGTARITPAGRAALNAEPSR